MRYAISNSTKMRIREAQGDDARLSRRDAILSAFTPTLRGSTSAYYNFGRSIDPETNTYRTSTSFYNSYSVSAGIDLFNGFLAVNNLKISKNSIMMGLSQDAVTEAEICLAVIEAYYNVLYYSQLEDIYASQEATASMAYERALKQEELGQKSHADVVQLASELADKQYDRVNASNACRDQRLTLEDLMFWPEELTLEIESSVPEKVEEVVRLDANGPSDLVDFARDHNPEILASKLQMRNAELALSTAKWQLSPRLSLYGGWSTTYYTYPGSGSSYPAFHNQFRNNGGEYVELSLSIPIFDRLSQHSAIRRKRNAFKTATAQYDQTTRDVESAVRRAVQDRDGACSAYIAAQRKADIQDEAYMLNLKRLDQGLISPIEYQTASNAYLAAKADRLNAMFKYLIKCAVVKYYSGVPYIDQ